MADTYLSGGAPMREVKRLLIGLVSSATWPLYMAMVSFAIKLGPWPRDVARPACVVVLGLSAALLVVNIGRMAFRRGGWAEEVLAAPKEVTRQFRRVGITLAIAGFVLLTPVALLTEGLIAPGGRPISASALDRLLVLGFELTCWILAYRLLRAHSPVLDWLGEEPARLGWAGQHRRSLTTMVLAGLGLVLILDASGFRFTSRRLSFGGLGTLILLAGCWVSFRLLARLIDHHAWRWRKPAEEQGAAPSATPESGVTLSTSVDDARAKLRTLARVVVALGGVIGWSYVWNIDIQLFQYIGESPLWTLTDRTVRVGDAVKMTVILVVTAGVWRYLNTFFTLAVFPRMPDDPGIRYAVVTLCRYLVLAVGLLTGLSAIHLGLEKIGVVLAALGVGLGFGLQEIVSNFVSGIILLLERPIRVGDIITVANMTGKVDRINIRATMIINGDNQSVIIPNRQFITGDLINWTHKDKIIRLQVKVNVAFGTDADKVTDLLLSIAQKDPDVLNNPVPAAMLDAIGDSALNFILNVFVPEPGLLGRVRHRLYGEVQRQFDHAGITIALPMRELRVHAMNPEPDHQTIPRPHHRRPDFAIKGPLPIPAEECHRGVDE